VLSTIKIDSNAKFYLPAFAPERIGLSSWGASSISYIEVDSELGRGADFEGTDLFTAFRHVLVEGGQWAETAFFKNCVAKIAAGHVLWKCRTSDEFHQRLDGDVRRMFASIKKFGYLSQVELAKKANEDTGATHPELGGFASARYHSRINPTHEIRVGFNESGELIFIDGRHRLAIAKLLQIPQVPAIVVFRQATWAHVREEFRAAHSKSGTYVSRHPDLKGFRVSSHAATAIAMSAPKVSASTLGLHVLSPAIHTR
jgi:hypothetical protein